MRVLNDGLTRHDVVIVGGHDVGMTQEHRYRLDSDTSFDCYRGPGVAHISHRYIGQLVTLTK